MFGGVRRCREKREGLWWIKGQAGNDLNSIAVLRRFAVSQQAQTSFKGRLKRPTQGLEAEQAQPLLQPRQRPAWRGRSRGAGARGKSAGKVGGCACAVAGSRLVRRPAQPRMEGWSRPKTRLRFPTQKTITTGGSIPCTQSRYFREFPKPTWKTCKRGGRNSLLQRWTSRSRTSPPICPKSSSRRVLGTGCWMSVGVWRASLSPEPGEGQAGPGVHVPVGGRETCPPLESVSPEGEFSCGPLTVV